MVKAKPRHRSIKQIINPRLPLRYEMGEEDLVLPGPAWKGPLKVDVYVNTNGRVGPPTKGDFRGTHRGAVRSGERHVDVVIDEEV